MRAAFDAFIETWTVKHDKAVECLINHRDPLAGFLRLPRRATNEQRDRKLVGDHPPPHGAIQGMSFEQDRARQ
jgi:hypothetical protein